MRRLILVIGMHRSGTSLLTQILSKLGIYLGEKSELDCTTESNEDGHFEYIKIRQIHDALLDKFGKTWCDVDSYGIDFSKAEVLEYKENLSKEIDHLFERHDLVAIKDPRSAMFLNLWEEILREKQIEPVYLYVIRNANEVAASLNKRDGIPYSYGIKVWTFYNVLIQDFLWNKGFLAVKFNDLFAGEMVSKICDYCGLKLADSPSIEGVAKERLRHNKSEELDMDEDGALDAIYKMSLSKDDLALYVKGFECQYKDKDKRIKDYELVTERDFLNDKSIVVYGAGEYGHKVANMLRKMGIENFTFCDRNPKKHGTIIDGIRVESISDLEEKRHLCLIIAIGGSGALRELMRYFLWLDDVCICSYFSLEKKYEMSCYDAGSTNINIKIRWYSEQIDRLERIKEANDKPILIYQNGKVGSMTIYNVLCSNNVECAHLHRNYFRNDILKELICGDEEREFADQVTIAKDAGLMEKLYGAYKGRKIITMVREPISVDFSTAFEWLGGGVLQRYLYKNNEKGIGFIDSVYSLMKLLMGREFNWFKEELEPATGIDIYKYSFDTSKGYSWIRNNDTEILVIQTERINGLFPVIEEFIERKLIYRDSSNVGSKKAYSFLYDRTKSELRLEKDYTNFYYGNNAEFEHFFSLEDREKFKKRWKIQ